MKVLALLAAITLVGLTACSSDQGPTQPGTDATTTAAPSFALASNTWSIRAAPPGNGLFAAAVGTAPNSAGESIVYLFGGREGSGSTTEGVRAYNVTTNTWSFKQSRVGVFSSNGVGKIGTLIYFSGGSPEISTPNEYTQAVWAYDYTQDRMIRKADLPIASGEGVTGAIGGKLYVLPGACSGERYPQPGYCVEERTRRFYSYDPATNTWAARASSPHFHRLGAAGVLNNKLYVAAGYSNSTRVANLDVYDPATNTWKTLAPVPTGGHSIGAVLQGKFYVITESAAYAYNPGTNSWVTKASPSESHDGMVKVTLNGSARLVAAGGAHGSESEIPNDTELYTP